MTSLAPNVSLKRSFISSVAENRSLSETVTYVSINIQAQEGIGFSQPVNAYLRPGRNDQPATPRLIMMAVPTFMY